MAGGILLRIRGITPVFLLQEMGDTLRFKLL